MFEKITQNIIPQGYNLTDQEIGQLHLIFNKYVDDALYKEMLDSLMKFLFKADIDRGSSDTLDSFELSFNYLLAEVERKENILLFYESTMIICGKIISNTYKNVMILNESDFDNTKSISLLHAVVTGLEMFIEGDGPRLLNPVSINLEKGDRQTFSLETKTTKELLTNIKLLIRTLYIKEDLVESIKTKLTGLNFEFYEDNIDLDKTVFNIKFDEINSHDFGFTDQEKTVLWIFNYIVDGENITLIKNPSGRLETNLPDSALTSILGELINQLHKNLWVNQRIDIEKALISLSERRKFQKKIKDYYKIYSELYDENINPNEYTKLKEIPTKKLVRKALEIRREIDPVLSEELEDSSSGDYVDLYRPYEPATEGDVENNPTEKKEISLQNVSGRLKKYGELGEMKNVKTSESQLRFISSVLDYIDEYVNNGSDISKLNQALSFQMYNGGLLFKINESKKTMIIGKKLNNAIKININQDDRMVVYNDEGECKIMILSGSEYHNKRSKINS